MVAEELSVQYVIEGSLQKSGDRIRISVQLIDALTGHHILAERFDRNTEDIFKLQDEIIFAILQSMNVIGDVDKLQSQYSVQTNNSNAYLKFMEAVYYMRFFSEDSLNKAQKAFREAIALDQNFAQAYSHLSYTYQQIGRYYTPSAESRGEYYEKALESAEKSLELDASQADSHWSLGRYYLLQKNFEMAFPSYSRAVDLEPGNSRIRGEFSEFLTFMHKLPEAVYQGKKAIRLDPLSPANPLVLGRAYFHLRQYEDAIEMHKKSLELMKYIPFNPAWPHLHLSMVYSEFGRDEEAYAHMQKVLKFDPRFNLEERRNALFFKDPADADREIEALRKAGAPEHPPTS
jgi:adenylate cyclase